MAPLLVLLLAQNPDYQKTIVALEEAYRAAPMPEILLSIAATYEQWPDHCKEAIATYQRLLDRHPESRELFRTADRMDKLLERCVAAVNEEIALREQYGIPSARPALWPADARRAEVVDLLERARAVDRDEANRLLVTLIEAGADVSIDRLNEMREHAWMILLRGDPDREQVLALLKRLHEVDLDEYQRLYVQLMEAGTDRARLDTIRRDAIGTLQAASRVPREHRTASSGCAANLAYEFGYLTVGSTPWADVYVNGEKVGTTPLSRHKVLAGCATIRAVNPDTGQERVAEITVRPNRVTIVKLDLTREPGGTKSSHID